MLTAAALAILFGRAPAASAQAPSGPQTLAATPAPAALPEPIYWKQNLFLIPYQWSSAADLGEAQAVWLFVSKDGGATWQKISEAKPQVRAFNYRAEGDGQYWFAIRTIDRNGRAWPAGPYQPELRVIVDTTMPRVEELSGQLRDDGTLEIRWRAADRNIDPDSWRVELQTDASDQWQVVSLPTAGAGATDVSAGQTIWTSPEGGRPIALRAVVYDRAGNPAVYRADIDPPATGDVASSQWPALISGRGDLPPAVAGDGPASPFGTARPPSTAGRSSAGWVSSSAAAPSDGDTSSVDPPQQWPASTIERAPFRLYGGAADLATDTATTYGRPKGVGQPLVVGAGTVPDGQPVEDGDGQPNGDDNRYAAPARPTQPTFTPLEPFREASLSRLPADGEDAPTREETFSSASSWPDATNWQPPPGVEPKLVSSRSFALEYELEEAGRRGVSKVELWGTRDGGQTWHRYASDDDNRSPLQVTVDGEGVYGFRIVVQGTAGTGMFPPRPGDQPELWVAVDLRRPRVELTAVEPGSGNLADHLILRWRAEDDNLERRPISLFYSSRPAGPWSALATNLENTGEYAWRLERHVPARFYLRLEARDTAGNLAAYQIAEPVLIERPQPTGRIQGVRPLRTTAQPASPAAR